MNESHHIFEWVTPHRTKTLLETSGCSSEDTNWKPAGVNPWVVQNLSVCEWIMTYIYIEATHWKPAGVDPWVVQNISVCEWVMIYIKPPSGNRRVSNPAESEVVQTTIVGGWVMSHRTKTFLGTSGCRTRQSHKWYKTQMYFSSI